MFRKLGSEIPIISSSNAAVSTTCPFTKTEKDLSANTLLYVFIDASNGARIKHASVRDLWSLRCWRVLLLIPRNRVLSILK